MMPPPYLPHAAHQQELNCAELHGLAPGGESSVFFGNISYDCQPEDLIQVMRTCGPFRDMKMMYGDDNKPKGYGFCTYNDPDTASSAIRNLNRVSINNRELKVYFASDKQSGTNLKPDEVRERDHAEVLGGGVSHNQVNQGEMLRPETSTVDELFRNFSDTQKEILIFSIGDAYNHLSPAHKKDFVAALAQDENILCSIEEIFEHVYRKLKNECGESNIMSNHTGMWNLQHQPTSSTFASTFHPSY